ncbi:hypothetical protein CVT24_009275 [Panaeolus cyanescens]|uniref:Uncharacterized protein n=1 Tax=Panaeolus cyanescens TaxID=181874 RepID=A0A409Y8H0_9AGAR|nr:hypothetical protein CVT24_009275 [Panaeolus cyanescens]
MCSISNTILALPVSGSSEYLASRDPGNDLRLVVREKPGQGKAAVVEKPKGAAAAGSDQHKGPNAASGKQKSPNANAAGAASPAKPKFKQHTFAEFQNKNLEEEDSDLSGIQTRARSKKP